MHPTAGWVEILVQRFVIVIIIDPKAPVFVDICCANADTNSGCTQGSDKPRLPHGNRIYADIHHDDIEDFDSWGER